MNGKIKTYKITFLCNSRINKSPDSQVIFGAICKIFKIYKGDDYLKKYLDSFSNHPLMIHTSMFPAELFPALKRPLLSTELMSKYMLNLPAHELLNNYEKLKEFRNIKYVSSKIYSKYISNGNIEKLTSDLMSNEIRLENGILKNKDDKINFEYKDLLATRIRHFSNIGEQDSELYYDRDIFYNRNQRFNIFVKTSLDMKYIEEIFEKLDYIPLGNRSSSGKNLFKYVTINEYTKADNNCQAKLLLSKCIPCDEDFNYDESEYAIESQNYVASKEFGNEYLGVITKLVEGSYMKIKTVKEYYGKIIPLKVGNKTIYHYGIGFTL